VTNQPFKTYKQILEFLFSSLPMYQRQGDSAFKKDLTNTLALLELADNPHTKIKTIHIAGTNGKGSSSHLIAAGLQAQGYKVGLYTSPHYKDFRERIKINGDYISIQYIKDFTNTYYQSFIDIKPSFFEMTVALAFTYFDDQNVDFAVIETGLGGRLDSTNVITPLLSVITNISYDHQNLLGNTLGEIAGEKAGIIKNNVPVVIGETQNEIIQIFTKKAKEKNTKIHFADQSCRIELLSNTTDTHTNCNVYINEFLWISNLSIEINGPFQIKNLITSLFSLYLLQDFISIDIEKIKSFFLHFKSKTKYQGRWQVLGNNPLIIADSAHNEAGIEIVLSELTKYNDRKWHFVIGFVNDKDIDKIITLFPKNATYYFAKANIPRGMEAEILFQKFTALGFSGKPYTSVKRAFASAKKIAKSEDLIFVGGSIFIVAEII